MKTIVAALAVAASLGSLAQAGVLKFRELEGSWKGRRTELRAGVGTYSPARLIGRFGSDQRFIITEDGTSPWLGSYRIKHAFRADGTYRSIQIQQGRILAIGTGTWKARRDTIRISGVSRNADGAVAFSGRITRVSEDRVIYTGTSGTLTVRIRADRRN